MKAKVSRTGYSSKFLMGAAKGRSKVKLIPYLRHNPSPLPHFPKKNILLQGKTETKNNVKESALFCFCNIESIEFVFRIAGH